MAKTQSSIRARLTKVAVEALPAPALAWDTDLKGYGVRVSPKGARAYFVHGRTASGRQVKLTIGRHGPLTAEQARAKAKRLLGAVASGEDPAAEKRKARQAEKARLEAPTVAELMTRYMAEHAERRKRPSSIRSDRCNIDRHILPALGAHKVADVTHAQLERLHGEISARAPITANRTVALLSKAFALAIKWGWRDTDNPCRGIERNPEERRERFLTPAELARLAAALNRRQDDRTAACIVFLMVTGARRGETLTARWRDFDLASHVWLKPSAHTKQKRSHRVPLNAAARSVLATLAARYPEAAPPPDALVFGGLEAINRLRRTWTVVRAEAQLPGLRLHDLRHGFATILASAGLSLPVIGALLGHSAPATTARYAHLLDDPLRQATERVGLMWQGFADADQGEVGPLRR